MTGDADFSMILDEAMRQAIAQFADWLGSGWTMTPEEAETLTKPTSAPAEYARGWNDAVATLKDAAELWMEGPYA